MQILQCLSAMHAEILVHMRLSVLPAISGIEDSVMLNDTWLYLILINRKRELQQLWKKTT